MVSLPQLASRGRELGLAARVGVGEGPRQEIGVEPQRAARARVLDTSLEALLGSPIDCRFVRSPSVTAVPSEWVRSLRRPA